MKRWKTSAGLKRKFMCIDCVRGYIRLKRGGEKHQRSVAHHHQKEDSESLQLRRILWNFSEDLEDAL